MVKRCPIHNNELPLRPLSLSANFAKTSDSDRLTTSNLQILSDLADLKSLLINDESESAAANSRPVNSRPVSVKVKTLENVRRSVNLSRCNDVSVTIAEANPNSKPLLQKMSVCAVVLKAELEEKGVGSTDSEIEKLRQCLGSQEHEVMELTWKLKESQRKTEETLKKLSLCDAEIAILKSCQNDEAEPLPDNEIQIRLGSRPPVEPKLATRSPVEPKLATGSPVEPKLATRSPVEPKLATGSPVEPKLATRSPVEPKLATGSPVELKPPTQPAVEPKLEFQSPVAAEPSSRPSVKPPPRKAVRRGTGLVTDSFAMGAKIKQMTGPLISSQELTKKVPVSKEEMMKKLGLVKKTAPKAAVAVSSPSPLPVVVGELFPIYEEVEMRFLATDERTKAKLFKELVRQLQTSQLRMETVVAELEDLKQVKRVTQPRLMSLALKNGFEHCEAVKLCLESVCKAVELLSVKVKDAPEAFKQQREKYKAQAVAAGASTDSGPYSPRSQQISIFTEALVEDVLTSLQEVNLLADTALTRFMRLVFSDQYHETPPQGNASPKSPINPPPKLFAKEKSLGSLVEFSGEASAPASPTSSEKSEIYDLRGPPSTSSDEGKATPKKMMQVKARPRPPKIGAQIGQY